MVSSRSGRAVNGFPVSVVIPAFNAAGFLTEAIESLLAQTVQPAEIVVVDDGSTDNTASVLGRFGPPVVVVRQENRGETASRNRGMEIASHRFLAFLDADDVAAPTRLERQLATLGAAPGAAACFTGYWRFDATGVIEERPGNGAALPSDPLQFLANCLVLGASAMIDRDVTGAARYPEAVSATGDIIFTAVLATAGRLVVAPEMLYGYREHARQTSLQNHPKAESYPYFEQRYQWARANAATVWPARSWAEIERALWDGLARQTEAAYWARSRQFFLQDREYIRRHWPSHLPRPGVAGWKWYPDWVWNTKSVLDRYLGRG